MLFEDRSRAESFGVVAESTTGRDRVSAALVDRCLRPARSACSTSAADGDRGALLRRAAASAWCRGGRRMRRWPDEGIESRCAVQLGGGAGVRSGDLGQAWHWIEPRSGAAKAASVLGDGGRLSVFWNFGCRRRESASCSRRSMHVSNPSSRSTPSRSARPERVRGGARRDRRLRPIRPARVALRMERDYETTACSSI